MLPIFHYEQRFGGDFFGKYHLVCFEFDVEVLISFIRSSASPGPIEVPLTRYFAGISTPSM